RLRGHVPPAPDHQGPQPRHRLVLDARRRVAGPQGGVRALARSGKFRRAGPPARKTRAIGPRRHTVDDVSPPDPGRNGISVPGRPLSVHDAAANFGGTMAGRLKDKVALVTAAGQGIGRAIAESFVAEGARVIATDLQPEKLAGLKSAKSVKLDVR